MTIKHRILTVEKELLTNSARLNYKRLDEILHEDYIEFGSSGSIWKRNDYFGEEGAGIRDLTLTDSTIVQLDDHIYLHTFIIHDKTAGNDSLRSSIWSTKEGLKLIFHQGTIKKLQ